MECDESCFDGMGTIVDTSLGTAIIDTHRAGPTDLSAYSQAFDSTKAYTSSQSERTPMLGHAGEAELSLSSSSDNHPPGSSHRRILPF